MDVPPASHIPDGGRSHGADPASHVVCLDVDSSSCRMPWHVVGPAGGRAQRGTSSEGLCGMVIGWLGWLGWSYGGDMMMI